MTKTKGIFRAFKYRNYRLFFFGQGVSFIGTMMQNTAQAWLIYRLTGSAAMLGLVAFAAQAPAFFMAPISGILSDRIERRSIILFADIIKISQAAILTLLSASGRIAPWHIVALAVLLGIANGIETTARHSMVADIVGDKKDLGNAIALNSLLFNAGRVAGPAAAGFFVAYAGETICFGANALSYIALIYALLAMNLPEVPLKKHKTHPVEDLKEGYEYSMSIKHIRNTIIFMAFISLTGASAIVLMPVFAGKVLNGGPQDLGLLMGSIGAGAMAGALYLAAHKRVTGLDKIIAVATAVFGAGLCLLPMTRSIWPAMMASAAAGAGMMLSSSASNTLVQSMTEDKFRGRVMSFYLMAVTGFGPLGNLITGMAAKRFGVGNMLSILGVLTIICAVFFAAGQGKHKFKITEH